jgi:hypothetical protein
MLMPSHCMQVRRLLSLRGAPALLAINFFPWLTHKETSWMRPLPRFPRADAAATSASASAAVSSHPNLSHPNSSYPVSADGSLPPFASTLADETDGPRPSATLAQDGADDWLPSLPFAHFLSPFSAALPELVAATDVATLPEKRLNLAGSRWISLPEKRLDLATALRVSKTQRSSNLASHVSAHYARRSGAKASADDL